MDKALKDQLERFSVLPAVSISSGSRTPSAGSKPGGEKFPTPVGGISSAGMNPRPLPPTMAGSANLPLAFSPLGTNANPRFFAGTTSLPTVAFQAMPLPTFSAVSIQDPRQMYAKPQDPTLERKRTEEERRKLKLKQSFEASRSKPATADALLTRINTDFAAIPSSSSSKQSPFQGSNSRPSTPMGLPASPKSDVPDSGKRTSLNVSSSSPVLSAQAAERPVIIQQISKVPDINDMMIKFSDLSSKHSPVRGFQNIPPTLRSAAPNPKKVEAFNDSQNARDWRNLPDDMSSVFSLHSSENGTASTTFPVSDLPPWCSADAGTLPPVYNSVLSVFKNRPIDKEAVIDVLVRSGLSRTTIMQIWSSCSRTNSGSLTRGELCAALALTGLAQSSFNVQHLTIDVLRRIPSPPVPQFIVPPMHPPVLSSPPGVPPPRIIDFPKGVSLPNQPKNPPMHEEEEFSDFVSATLPVSQPTPAGQSSLVAAALFHPPTSVMPVLVPPPTSQINSPPLGNKKFGNAELFNDNGTVSLTSMPSALTPFVPPVAFGETNVQKIQSDSTEESADIVFRDKLVETDPYAPLRELNLANQTELPVTTPSPDSPSVWLPPTIVEAADALITEEYSGFTGSDAGVLESSLDNSFWITSPSSETQSVSSLDLANLGPQLTLDEILTLNEATTKENERNSPASNDLRIPIEEVQTSEQSRDNYAEIWTKALNSCGMLLQEACTVLNSVNSSKTLVAAMKKATPHIFNLIEVYRIARRIYLSARSCGLMHDVGIMEAIKETEEAWADFIAFLSMGSLEPQPGSMDFSGAEFGPQIPPVLSVCGLCLLNVDGRSKSRKNEMDAIKVEHGGRFYHATCANFWVNCVESCLPSLVYSDNMP